MYPKSEKQNEKDRKGIYLNKEKSTSEKGRKDERKKVKEILDSPQNEWKWQISVMFSWT